MVVDFRLQPQWIFFILDSAVFSHFPNNPSALHYNTALFNGKLWNIKINSIFKVANIPWYKQISMFYVL